jgi:hypothetical protein
LFFAPLADGRFSKLPILIRHSLLKGQGHCHGPVMIPNAFQNGPLHIRQQGGHVDAVLSGLLPRVATRHTSGISTRILHIRSVYHFLQHVQGGGVSQLDILSRRRYNDFCL